MKSILRKTLRGPLQALYATKVWNALFKNPRELGYWRENVERMEAWYAGEAEYRFPHPTEETRVTGGDRRQDAIRTYIKAELEYASYLKDMRLAPEVFVGKKIADIGAGPMPLTLVFDDCERWSVDHLIDQYEGLGYPLADFRDRVNYLCCSAEAIEAEDDSFDVVLSCNALDHVDDFDKAASEMKRVLKPEGWMHILLNYHAPTQTETQVLTDERVEKALAGIGLRKIYSLAGGWGFDDGQTVLWSNLPAECIASEPSQETGGPSPIEAAA